MTLGADKPNADIPYPTLWLDFSTPTMRDICCERMYAKGFGKAAH